MKGLLRKDLYVFLNTGKLFILMLVVLACIPGDALFGYVMLYCSLLASITLMANDEQSRWDDLAAMLPYPKRDIVLGKYLISWIFLLTMSALHVLSSRLTGMEVFESGFLSSTALYMSAALIISAVSIPVNYRFGVNKGRFVIVIIVAVFVSFSIASANAVVPVLSRVSRFLRPSYILPAALALNFLSIPISVACYKARMDK